MGGQVMLFTTTVRVFLVQGSVPLRGVHVELYDRDRRTADDLLGASRTDARGEVVFRYQSSVFGMDEIVDGVAFWNTRPEVYAAVLNAGGEVVQLDTRGGIGQPDCARNDRTA